MLFERKEKVNLTDFSSPDVVIKCSDTDVFTHRYYIHCIKVRGCLCIWSLTTR